MIEKEQQIMSLLIIVTRLNRESTLPNSWTHHIRKDARAHMLIQSQPVHARSSQDDGVIFARLKLTQARIHIAAQRKDLQIRPQRLQLALSTQAAGADFCA